MCTWTYLIFCLYAVHGDGLNNHRHMKQVKWKVCMHYTTYKAQAVYCRHTRIPTQLTSFWSSHHDSNNIIHLHKGAPQVIIFTTTLLPYVVHVLKYKLTCYFWLRPMPVRILYVYYVFQMTKLDEMHSFDSKKLIMI